jgi:hypothetical protein
MRKLFGDGVKARANGPEIVLYSKRGCHLCGAVESEILSKSRNRLVVVDIEDDKVLYDEYWLRIPVVSVGGEVLFEVKMMDPAGEWKAKLVRLLESKSPS